MYQPPDNKASQAVGILEVLYEKFKHHNKKRRLQISACGRILQSPTIFG
jgi:hypothetical protein